MCTVLRNGGALDILVQNCEPIGGDNEEEEEVVVVAEGHGENDQANEEEIEKRLEIQFLSAKLLEQCLSADNRAYVVDNGLVDVVKLATKYANQTNSVNQSRVGTGILEHLFKHSEDTCKDIINMGGLSSIIYQCRQSDVITLRHCASALANLSLHGGADNQVTMIQKKAPVWLFPLAFHTDDNIKYYACLAIAVLVANKEVEAAVLQSGTLNLVEPFVTSHNPQEFATSSTAHIHGQSKNWLAHLVPVLNSKREEARSLASFHFAMESWIKKKQGHTSVKKST